MAAYHPIYSFTSFKGNSLKNKASKRMEQSNVNTNNNNKSSNTNVNTTNADVNSSAQQGHTQVPSQPLTKVVPAATMSPASAWLGTWVSPSEINSLQQTGLRLSELQQSGLQQSQQMQQAFQPSSQQYSSSMSENVQYNQGEDTVTVLGETGILVNKQEIINWTGQLPLSEYPINQDSNPEIIRKKAESKLTYEQEICFRYLRPPTPPAPGDIVIRQERDIVVQPAPPIVIRQQPARPETPAPLVFREVPPKRPPFVERKIITISGKRLPPPPRKVVIERLAPLPPKPASIIVERWLAYKEQKRRVIFEKSSEPAPFFEKPRNVVIQWEPPQVEIRRVVKDLGVVIADPVDYLAKYGASLKMAHEMPDFIQQIRSSADYSLASQVEDRGESFRYQLVGDVQALLRIDLDREGLSEYKTFIRGFSTQDYSQDLSYSNQTYQPYSQQAGSINRAEETSSFQTNQNLQSWLGSEKGTQINFGGGSSVQLGSQNLAHRRSFVERSLERVLSSIKRRNTDRLTRSECKIVLAMINNDLNRTYDEESALRFLSGLSYADDDTVSTEKFRHLIVNSV